MITLPALIVHHEFPKEHFVKVISLIVALSQFTYAFGPGVLGAIRDMTGSYTGPLLLCLVLQCLAAVFVVMGRPALAGPGYQKLE